MSAFINRQKSLYKSLNPCYCPAAQVTVYFTSDGLNHILYNRRRPRSHDERHYRAGLITHIVEVITKAPVAIQKVHASDPSCSLWILWHEVVDRNNRKLKIKVLLRKIGNGNVHFLSIMQKKPRNNKTKNPRF
ncbi:hypothetical protein C4571_00835 [Candidatus Parcubacteria bacterium]|nr:MAG: hypothetical protein C4571_00835 [Candidatus Parcubacteria bacterium]